MTESPKPVDLEELERQIEVQSRQVSGLFVVYVQHRDVLALIAELRTLREAQRWIACSERMPGTDERVLVWFEGFGGRRVVVALRETEEQNGEADGWRQASGQWLPANAVLQWSALPDAPEGEL